MNIPNGFKLVPEVATLEMKSAGWRECDRQGIEPESIEMQTIWTAMHLEAPALLQASQPVKMANVMRAYEYACDHPDKYLRGTSNWCAAVAWKLNQLESPATTPPQPIYDEAKERELFEASRNAHTVRRNEHGDYVLPSAQDAWSGRSQCAQSRANTGYMGHPSKDVLRFHFEDNSCLDFQMTFTPIADGRIFEDGWSGDKL